MFMHENHNIVLDEEWCLVKVYPRIWAFGAETVF